jgi:uncharacterized protein YjdB
MNLKKVSTIIATIAMLGAGLGMAITDKSVNIVDAAITSKTVTLPNRATDNNTAFTTATIYTSDYSLKDATNGSFIVSTEAINNVYAGVSGFKFSSSSTNGVWTFTVSETITKIKVNFARFGTDTSPIKISSLDDSLNTTGTVSGTTFFEISSCSSDQFKIEATGSSSGTHRFYVSSIEFTYDDGLSGIPVSSVSLNKSTSSLYVGGTEQLTETVLPLDASNKAVSWSSSASGVASVNSSGFVTAVSAGTATITVTTVDQGKTATCDYTITAVVLNNISIKTPATKTSFALGEGFTYAGLVINAVYNSGTVEVTSGFTVTGVDTKALGTQTATVTYLGKTIAYSVDVTNQGASVGTAITMSDLIISEYIEGASYNKAIEIYNGTGASIDLSGYSLKIASNGSSTWGNALTLSGTIANKDVYVLAHKDAASDILAVSDFSETTPSVINFNGDDSVGLFKGTSLIDLFGNVTDNTDPGTSWAVPYYGSGETTATTQDNTWVRHSSITGPNSTSPFASTEWVVYPVETHLYLGSHASGSGNVTPTEQATAFANYIVTGIGLNAQGSCETVFSELSAEYGYMDSDSKTIFTSDEGAVFASARLRYNYLANYTGGTPLPSPIGDVMETRVNGKEIWIIIIAFTVIAGASLLARRKRIIR